MDTKDKTNMQIEEQENVLNPKDKDGYDVADATKDVVNAAGATVKGAVKTVGAFAKFVSFIFSNLPLVGVIATVIVAAWLFLFNPFGWNMNLFGKPQIEKTANIVEEIKKISELTTACYYEESVLQNNKFTTKKHWIGNDVDTVKHTVVLTAMCRVRAGYDLSMLGENDLIVKGDTVDIKLPAPKIFDVISNPSDYRIFEEIGDWEHEEIVAMQVQGKERMLQNALENNILEKANIIGKERVATLFATFGFNVVNVTLTDVPAYVAPEQPEAVVEQVAPAVEEAVEEVAAPVVEEVAAPAVEEVAEEVAAPATEAVVAEEQVAA